MAVVQSPFTYLLQTGGTNQYLNPTLVPNGGVSTVSTPPGDDFLDLGQPVTVDFTDPANNGLDGSYTFTGYDAGLQSQGTFIAQAPGPNGSFYLFSDHAVASDAVINVNPGNPPYPICFLTGTMIATPGGYVAVEALAIGGLVLTLDGREVPVKWLGKQTVRTLFGIPEGRLPVCVAAGSLGGGVPVRDLRVTSDHALLIDGVLVHAGALVNGTTVRRIANEELGESFVVYHIETEDHEVVLAEGAPAETFIDNVSRQRFDNFAEYQALYGPHPEPMRELDQPRAMSRRQVHPAIHARIAATAADILPKGEQAA